MSSALNRFDSRLSSPALTSNGFSPEQHVVIYQIWLNQRTPAKSLQHHVFALCIVEHESATPGSDFLTPKSISLPGHKGISLGLARHRTQLADFRNLLVAMESIEEVDFGIGAVKVTGLVFDAEKFVRADATELFSINKTLSNNFYGGSYVQSYATDTPLPDLPDLMPEGLPSVGLTQALAELTDLDLNANPAHIGNFLIQFRELPLAIDISRPHAGEELVVKGAWRGDCQPKSMRLIATFDDDVSLPVTVSGKSWTKTIKSFRDFREFRLDIQERKSGDLVYGVARTGFINQVIVNMNMQSGGGPDRLSVNGQKEDVLRVSTDEMIVKGKTEQTQRVREQKAARAAELVRLEQRLAFLSYADGRSSPDHVGAINDVNKIIKRYGRSGAWLWDPYLSGVDVLKTLGRSIYSGSDLRALSDRKSPPATCGNVQLTELETWRAAQVQTLTDGLQNMTGVKLEFRVRTGVGGYAFHDRFLILPQSDGSYLAWSLGISVNALGKKHHIIQQVEHAEQIADSFLRLWNDLEADHLTKVWPV